MTSMIYPDLPEMALSIYNPWCWLIGSGLKDIENRDRRTHVRGPIALHAGRQMAGDALQALINNVHPVTGDGPFFIDGMPKDWMEMADGKLNGGIIGVADIVDCVEDHPSKWFVGDFGYVLANARRVPFIPVIGKQGYFRWRSRIVQPHEAAA